MVVRAVRSLDRKWARRAVARQRWPPWRWPVPAARAGGDAAGAHGRAASPGIGGRRGGTPTSPCARNTIDFPMLIHARAPERVSAWRWEASPLCACTVVGIGPAIDFRRASAGRSLRPSWASWAPVGYLRACRPFSRPLDPRSRAPFPHVRALSPDYVVGGWENCMALLRRFCTSLSRARCVQAYIFIQLLIT